MKIRYEHIQSANLAVILAIGAATAWAIIIYCIVGFVILLLPTTFYNRSSLNRYLAIAFDGTPMIASFDVKNITEEYRTLDGQLVPDGRKIPMLRETLLNGPAWQLNHYRGLQWSKRIVKLTPTEWYFLHDGRLHGSGYFVGYSPLTKFTIGYFGRAGFRLDEPPADERFQVDGRRLLLSNITIIPYSYDGSHRVTSLYLLADDGLYQIDLAGLAVKLLLEGTNLVSAGILYANASVTESAQAQGLLVRTPDRVLELDFNGKLLRSHLLPQALLNMDWLWYEPSVVNIMIQECPFGEELYWIDAEGNIVRQEHLDLNQTSARSIEMRTLEKVFVTIAAPSVGMVAAFCAIDAWGQNMRKSGAYSVALRKTLGDTWEILLSTGLISICTACLCYRRQRKYALPWTIPWTIFVLVFGAPAYLGYLFHRSWPARMPCPSCGRLAPRDRSACFACGREFPAPNPKGIEVFA
jgi:hypothetical protein